MSKQLSLVPSPPDLAADHAREVLAVQEKRRRPPLGSLPVVGFLPIIEDEFRPPIRSKRQKTSAPRVLREGARPQSLGTGRLTRRERQFAEWDQWKVEADGLRVGPPATFGDCPPSGACPNVGCRHHAGIEVDGEVVKINFPDRDIHELRETCTLRVANAGELKKSIEQEGNENEPELKYAVMRCDEVGDVLNLTPERVRQIEVEAKENFRRKFAEMFPELLEEWARQ